MVGAGGVGVRAHADKTILPTNYSEQNTFHYLKMQQAEVKLQSETLDQGICDTIWRDLKSVLIKIRYILVPNWNLQPNEPAVKQLRNWDLWGPLILCLLLSFTLDFGIDTKGKSFGILFLVMWGGAFVVTINCKLLGGHISFFQCVCVLGYCIFPVNIAALAIVLLKGVKINLLLIKMVIVGVAVVWSTVSSITFTSVMVDPGKRAIAIYPIFLFYLFIAWFALFI